MEKILEELHQKKEKAENKLQQEQRKQPAGKPHPVL